MLLFLYIENWRKKDKKTTYDLARESILHLLHKDLTTKESLNIFEDISAEFIIKMGERLENINREQKLLEIFLEKVNK